MTKETHHAAVAAIQFALSNPEGMEFLRLWNEGEFDILRRDWPEAPDSVYIGADSKRRPYNVSGSLSEYGVFPECDVQQRESSAPVGFDEWFDEYTKNNYTDEMLAEAAWKAALTGTAELVGLLDEVRSHFTRDDDLPDNLLPRIDAALAALTGEQ